MGLLIRVSVLCAQGDYDIPLSVYYDYVFTAAEQAGAALMQPWELVPFHVPPGVPTHLAPSPVLAVWFWWTDQP